MITNKLACTLLLAATLLATTACPSRSAVQAIGEIKGAMSWDKGGERPDPSAAADALSISATTAAGVALPGAKVVFGTPSDSGTRVSVPYTVSKLPLNTVIRLEVKPKHVQGSFIRDGNPQDAVCSIAQPVVSQFDFHFVPAP